MFLNSLTSLNVFQQDIPKLPMGKYAHIITLRETNSFALFQTDGELNISRVSLGRKEQTPSTRIVLFKRKQSTPERLTGREILRRYGLVENCKYNTAEFCKRCPDCIYYGFAIGDSGSERSKVLVDSAFSLTGYDMSHQQFTFNAPSENGTMSEDGKMKTVLRTKRYGAQNTRTGTVENHVTAIVFSDGEIFSNLQLTQAIYDILPPEHRAKTPMPQAAVIEAMETAVQTLLSEDGLVAQLYSGERLNALLHEILQITSDEASLTAVLQQANAEANRYAQVHGVGAKEAKAKK